MQEQIDRILDSYLAGNFDLVLLHCMKLHHARAFELQLVLDILDGEEPDDGFIDLMYKKYYGIRMIHRKNGGDTKYD